MTAVSRVQQSPKAQNALRVFLENSARKNGSGNKCSTVVL